ncbi:MAG: sigma-70 family RNA polymerase sigma factor [Planctomycetes bacterium]|nr:sigma-70 family RNA polymerase sigma factor [Planctomycetota bacterium]
MSMADPSFRPESLIEHREFVRALARRLLADDHGAEDVAQEACIAALESPPRSGEALRAWLARVTRNLSINTLRERNRRARREQLVARPEATEEGIDARLHAQRRVIEAVMALREPFKTAIWMRWYENLPPREIARRTRVPVETVKSRLKRGLAELKLALDHEFGERSEWLRALVPLTWVEKSAVGTSTVAIGSAALVLVVATWVVKSATDATGSAVLVAGTTPTNPEALVAAEGTHPRPLGSRRAALPVATALEPVVAASSAAPDRTVAVTGASALSGPEFALAFEVPDGLRVDDFVCSLELDNAFADLATCQTAPVAAEPVPHVRFAETPRTSLLGGGARTTYTLRLSSRDGLWSGAQRVIAAERSAAEPVHIVLEARAVMEGRVLTHDGRAVVGARVRITHGVVAETHTSSRGEWSLAGIAPGPVQVALRSMEQAEVTQAVTLAPLERRHLDITLASAPTVSLTGALVSRSGTHAPRGTVRLVSVSDPTFVIEAPTERDALPGARQDSFRFDALAPGEYELFPPMDDAFAWSPAALVVTVPCASPRFVCRDDVPTVAVALRAVAGDEDTRIESLRATILLDRYDVGRRKALAIEPRALHVEAHDGVALFPDIPLGMRGWWLVEADGKSSVWGSLDDLARRGGRLETEARLESGWTAHLWIGTRDANGREIALSDARIFTRGGALLTKSLADGHALLELLFDPGRIRIDLPGWHVAGWEGFSNGKLRQTRDLHRVWMERDN